MYVSLIYVTHYFPAYNAQLIRNEAGDIVEKVELFDQFVNKKTGRTSHAYRVNYRHMDRNLTNEEVDQLQARVRAELVKQLNVELR
jgi:phenylalanyl-tRNA synthetase alpha chain